MTGMAHDSGRTMLTSLPDFTHEQSAWAAGFRSVAGVDEAGRGPLAGPVVAAAVILNPGALPEGLNDSKKISEARRETLFAEICATSAVGIASAPLSIIEERNIRGATLWAMRHAVAALPWQTDFVLVDGRDVPKALPCRSAPLIGGDGVSLSIAAASIVAKVTRDRMCATMHTDSPAHGFSVHKGYGTAHHLAALNSEGPCVHHRRDFGPVARLIAAAKA